MQPTRCHVVSLAALAGLLTAGVGKSVGAQVAYDAPGTRVEVLGLHRWTLGALQDSVRRRVPGQSLSDAACMVTLRDSLHFADALVEDHTYSTPGEPTRRYLIIKVIEPQDSARVHWRPAPRDSFTVLRPSYAGLVLPVTDSRGRFWMGRLLGGTNVGATQKIMELLERTQVSAALARPLLHQNGSWVLTHLRAEYPGASVAAHALLVRLNGGHDLGRSDAAWARWLATL